MGGDFNCLLNPIVDKRGENLMPRQSVINVIERLQWELDLHDIWRIKNPTERSFTWSQSEPLVLSRLDYWLISTSMSDNVCDVDITPSIKTDHSAIKIELKWGKQRTAYHAVNDFNSLSEMIRDCSNVNIFKRQVYSFLI